MCGAKQATLCGVFGWKKLVVSITINTYVFVYRRYGRESPLKPFLFFVFFRVQRFRILIQNVSTRAHWILAAVVRFASNLNDDKHNSLNSLNWYGFFFPAHNAENKCVCHRLNELTAVWLVSFALRYVCTPVKSISNESKKKKQSNALIVIVAMCSAFSIHKENNFNLIIINEPFYHHDSLFVDNIFD